MRVPAEHLFLYAEAPVRALLKQAGFTVVELGVGLFPHDMWIVATPGATLAAREDTLAGLNPQTAVLITLYRRSAAQAIERVAVEDDRSSHQSQVAAARAELAAVRVDQREKAKLIALTSEELDAVRRDQRAKTALIASISQELADIRTDQEAKEALITSVSLELAAQRPDAEIVGHDLHAT